MYGYESRTIKKANCWGIDAFELWFCRRLLSLLDCREIKPADPKGNQSWMFIGRTHVKAETPILWPLYVKNILIGNEPDAGKDWRQEKWQQRMRWLDGITTSVDMSWASSGSWWRTGKPAVLHSMGSQRVGYDERLNWLMQWLNYVILGHNNTCLSIYN